jgi:hypothetical protein
MMEDMEPLFRKYNVNLIFSGHNHAYVRTKSVMGNHPSVVTVDTADHSPIYLTVGTGGDSHSRGPIHDTPEPWIAARDNTRFGAGRLQLANATHAFWERLLIDDDDDDDDVVAEDNDPSLRDPVWFINHHHS